MSLPFSLHDRHWMWEQDDIPVSPPGFPSTRDCCSSVQLPSIPKYTHAFTARACVCKYFYHHRIHRYSRLSPMSTQPLYHPTSQAKTPRLSPRSPAVSPPGLSGTDGGAAATKERRAHNNAHPPKKGVKVDADAEAVAEGPGHCTSETRMALGHDIRQTRNVSPCAPFISSP